MTVKEMTRISLFTAMLIVATISIPPIMVPVVDVPFTLQTLVVMVAAIILKPKEAF